MKMKNVEYREENFVTNFQIQNFQIKILLQIVTIIWFYTMTQIKYTQNTNSFEMQT